MSRRMPRAAMSVATAIAIVVLSFGLATVMYPLVVGTFRLLDAAWLYFNLPSTPKIGAAHHHGGEGHTDARKN